MLQQSFHYGANEMTPLITNQMNKTIETSYDILIKKNGWCFFVTLFYKALAPTHLVV
jgi:hypothetical protein